MIGFDARYAYQRFTARGQFVHASLSNTAEYNDLTGRDLGSALQGWYVEGAYMHLLLAHWLKMMHTTALMLPQD